MGVDATLTAQGFLVTGPTNTPMVALGTTSAAAASTPYKGKGIALIDENGALYTWNGTAYSLGGGGGSIASTPYAAALPLDLVSGREMPATYLKNLSAAQVLSVATNPAPVNNGNVNVTLVADGVTPVSLASGAFANPGDFNYSNVVGQVHEITVVQRPLGAIIFCQLGAVVNGAARPTSPSITTQPVAQSVTAPATATYSVAATPGAGTIAYQWQKMPSGGAFADITGATSASYTTPATATSDSASSFRCVVSNSTGGSVTSNSASLTVAPVGTLSALFKDGFSVANSTRTDGAGNQNLDQHAPDVSNVEGNRWSGYLYDTLVPGQGARVGHAGTDRYYYPIASAQPKGLLIDFSLDAGDNRLALLSTFRDAGDRSGTASAQNYFFYIEPVSVQLFKYVGGTYTQLGNVASTAWGGGARSVLTATIDTGGTMTVSANGTQLFTAPIDSLASAKGVSYGCNANDFDSQGKRASVFRFEVFA